MKQYSKIMLLITMSFLWAKELELGSTLPLSEIKMADISGKDVSLKDAKGENGLLVIFSCNMCPWVIAWEDRYVSLTNEFKPQGVGIIAINSNEKQFDSVDSMEEMQKHAKELGYNFYYTMDQGSKLAREFGATRTPHIYLFDQNDKLVYRGAIDDNARKPDKVEQTYLADAIDNMLGGAPNRSCQLPKRWAAVSNSPNSPYMKFETFVLEREQSLWENEVQYNLSESGVHPGTINDLFDQDEINEILNTELTYSPTQGSPALRDAISSIYDNVAAADVLVTNGSAEANLVAILTLLSAGDELIYMVPNYLQIRGIARAIGVEVKEIALQEELNWKLDLDELASMVTEKTKMIAVCHPNNPTGSVLPKEQIDAIINIAEKVGAYVLADEVYRGAELNDEECASFINTGYEKAIVNCGLSKAYGFPGLRVGWTIGSNDYMHSAWAVKDHTSICLGRLSDLMATKILQPADASANSGQNPISAPRQSGYYTGLGEFI
jgi:histidinol-phosphate/aromatic aminotransferase/cobyric acid decarboxylase-like protein/peroxiredoxin